MILILHYLRDPKLWEYGIVSIMGKAGCISSTVVCGSWDAGSGFVGMSVQTTVGA